MECMKCGRSSKDGHVFCPECLEVMARYPVKKDAVVHIPKRNDTVERPAQQAPSPNTILRQQRLTIRVLTAVVILLSVLLCAITGMLVYTLQNPSNPPSFSDTVLP